MDRFDRMAIVALAVLAVSITVVVYAHRQEAKPGLNRERRAAAEAPAVRSDELENGARLARNLIEAGSLAQAEEMVRDLKQKFPYQAELSLLMGDVLMRKQDPVKAVYEYRDAIDLNPDYLDKKTPLFQGKKLKAAVGEALAEIESRQKRSPDDPSLRQEKKMIYYLYRKIAGSCG